MEIAEVTIAGIGAVPLVLALTELVKRLGLPVQYAPLLSVAFGIAIIAIAQDFTPTALTTGLVVGLSASGLWSGVKSFGRGK